MRRIQTPLALACLAVLLSSVARAIEIPEAGACPPYSVPPGRAGAADAADVVPALLQPGQRIEVAAMARLTDYLPPEVWERRDVFFYEGQELEIGPCHRRYPAPPGFERATAENAGRARLDAEGNLLNYAGTGLPFASGAIQLDDPQAGLRWAWDYRYRYIGSGFRGTFSIRHVDRRGQRVQRFVGSFFLQPFYGLPSVRSLDDLRSFAAGGRFISPQVARGVAWRQYRPLESDRKPRRSDDVFVWLPSSRRVKRAPPQAAEGIYMPDYTQARGSANEVFQLPTGGHIDLGQGSLNPLRKGFVGLLIRPNAYTWHIERVQDVLAPINVRSLGYPTDKERAFGPSGLSLASERWDLRRAMVLHADRKDRGGRYRELTLYVDAQVQQPLYLISRGSGGRIYEVGIFAGRFTGDDPLATRWEGGDLEFGVILPVAQTFWVAGGESWMRESFDLETAPPSDDELREFLTTRRLARGR